MKEIIHSEVELPSNRRFGFFFATLFLFCGSYSLIIGSMILSTIFFVLAILFLIVAIVHDKLLLPLNKIWTKLGLILGKIFSPIILGVIFFGVFASIGFLMRLFGRDELRLKVKERKSYWKKRSPFNKRDYNFKQQF